MKRHLLMFVGILAILLIMLNVIGCSNGADPGDEVEVVELTFAHPFPATHHHHVDIIEPFVKEIMEKAKAGSRSMSTPAVPLLQELQP